MIEAKATEQTIARTFSAYVECALWAECDDDTQSLDILYGADDITTEALEQMREDVTAFLESCWDEGFDLSPIEPEQIGHDFWLTRNHHGAGFWDRGLGELGDKLTALAHGYGDASLYVGDDGRIHLA